MVLYTKHDVMYRDTSNAIWWTLQTRLGTSVGTYDNIWWENALLFMSQRLWGLDVVLPSRAPAREFKFCTTITQQYLCLMDQTDKEEFQPPRYVATTESFLSSPAYVAMDATVLNVLGSLLPNRVYCHGSAPEI